MNVDYNDIGLFKSESVCEKFSFLNFIAKMRYFILRTFDFYGMLYSRGQFDRLREPFKAAVRQNKTRSAQP